MTITPCLKKVPPLTCYNFDIHGWITIIFGTHVTEKVGNQYVLYFPTSPDLCFCITWGNTKPKNCIFSLKWGIHFTKNTQNTLKYHLVTDEPLFTVKTIDWMHQTGPGILLSVTHMLYVNQICHGVGRCRSLCKRWQLFFVKLEWKSIDSFIGISYYLNKCRCYQTHNRWQFFFQEDSTLRVAQFNCCSTLD